MITGWTQKLAYALLGASVAVVALVLYWQTESGSKHLLQSLATGDQCLDNDLDAINTEDSEEDITFVGCGGFF